MNIIKNLMQVLKPKYENLKTNSQNSILSFCDEFSKLEKCMMRLLRFFIFWEMELDDDDVNDAVKILKFRQREILVLKKKFDRHYKKLFPLVTAVDFPQTAMDADALCVKNISGYVKQDACVKFVRKIFLHKSDIYKRYIAESNYRTEQTKNIFSAVDDAWAKYSYIKNTLLQMMCTSDVQNVASVKEEDSL